MLLEWELTVGTVLTGHKYLLMFSFGFYLKGITSFLAELAELVPKKTQTDSMSIRMLT